ncbi:MAG: sugar ABC transporter substrate-binding protein [Bacillota bacterium]
MKKWPFSAYVFGTIIAITLAACARNPEPKPVQPPIMIGVSIGNLDRDVAAVLRDTMKGREKQDNARIMWFDAEGDPAKQEEQIDNLIKREVRAIILQVAEPEMGGLLARKIMLANIKLVGIYSLPRETPFDGYVSTDNRRLGELQASFIADITGAKASPGVPVLLLRGPQADYAMQEMAEGFAAVGKNLGLAISSRDWDPQKLGFAEENLEMLLAQDKRPRAIAAQTDRQTKLLLEIVERKGLAEQIVTVGSGASLDAAAALAGGNHEAEADLMPDQVGNHAYQAALDLAKTGSWNFDKTIRLGSSDLPAKIIPARLVTPENLYLLEQRFGQDKLKEKQQEKQGGGGQGQGGGSNPKNSQGKSSSNPGNSPGGQQKSKVVITTSDGNTMEIDVPGEIVGITVQKQGGQQQKQQGQQQ